MNSETGPDMCDNNGNKEHYVVSKVTCMYIWGSQQRNDV